MVNNRFLEYTHFIQLVVTNTINFLSLTLYGIGVALPHSFYQCQFVFFFISQKYFLHLFLNLKAVMKEHCPRCTQICKKQMNLMPNDSSASIFSLRQQSIHHTDITHKFSGFYFALTLTINKRYTSYNLQIQTKTIQFFLKIFSSIATFILFLPWKKENLFFLLSFNV